MRQKITNIYHYDELSDEAKAHALENWRKNMAEVFWQDEITDSFKSVFKHTNGVKLMDWSIDAFGPGTDCRVEFTQDEAAGLTGKRAAAWLENNLIASLRVPWKGAKRWELAQYGQYYRPGMVKPCPFTGYCADDDFLDALRKDIKEGRSLKDAFRGLADEAARLIGQEYDEQQKEEYFADFAAANEYEFDEKGDLA